MIKRIYNLDELIWARENRRAVFMPKSRIWTKPKPAAFMLNQPGMVLWMLFREGMFVYQKEEKQ